MKKKYKILIVVILILLVVAGSLFFILKNKDKENKKIEVKILDTISEYGYTINDRDSQLYKDEFDKLKEILEESEINEEEYAKQVAKMYVIDLFSMESKIQKTDVGGIEFVLSSEKENYLNDVSNSYYDLLEDDSYSTRKQELPMVKSIEIINTEITTYTTKENEKVDAYLIELSWTYEKDLGDQTKGFVTIIKDGIYECVVSFSENKEED